MNFNYLIACFVSFCSSAALGQDKKTERIMSENGNKNEVTILSPHSLRVVQKGKGNVVVSEQSDSMHSLKMVTAPDVSHKEGNVIVFTQTSTGDSRELANTSAIQQSGNGNRVVIRQSGSGNSISVSQSASEKKKQ